MPIWIVDRKRVGSSPSSIATRADASPSSASRASRPRRAVTRAISDIAKAPFSRIRATRRKISIFGLSGKSVERPGRSPLVASNDMTCCRRQGGDQRRDEAERLRHGMCRDPDDRGGAGRGRSRSGANERVRAMAGESVLRATSPGAFAAVALVAHGVFRCGRKGHCRGVSTTHGAEIVSSQLLICVVCLRASCLSGPGLSRPGGPRGVRRSVRQARGFAATSVTMSHFFSLGTVG